MKIKGRICPCFSSMIALPLPSTKSSFTLRSPTKHPVGAKNDRFKHPWKERKVSEKLTNTYLHTRPFVVKKGLTTLEMTVGTHAGLAALKINR